MRIRVGAKNKKIQGFTLVEAIIVIAVIGLISAVVFIAIPQLQMSVRDNHRKAYAKEVYQELLEFIKNNGRFPGCSNHANSTVPCGPAVEAQALKFLRNYMPQGKDPLVNSDGRSEYLDKNNITTPEPRYRKAGHTYFMFSMDHNLVGDPPAPLEDRIGKVFIGGGHWCSYSKPQADQPGWYPIASDHAAGHELHLDNFFVAVTLEKGMFYCLDNYDGDA